jgi:beta-lactamase regulating signal transducer with metallopeptidase domain
MQGYLVTENEPWLELLLVLTVGTTVIVALAALANRLVRSAIWQRTIWQVTTLGVLTLMLVEVTGAGPALIGLWRTQMKTAASGRRTGEGGRGKVNGGRWTADGTGRLLTTRHSPLTTLHSPLTESEQTAAAAIDLVWIDDAELGNDNLLERDLFAASGRDALGDTIDSAHLAISLPGEPAHAWQYAWDERATGGLPTSTQSDAVVATTVDEPPAANASWWLAAIWAVGATVIAARTVYAGALLWAFRWRGTRLRYGPLCERIDRLARRLGLRRRVCVLEAAGLKAPVAFGSFSPAVALPVSFADDFDRRQQDAVLAHELAHLAARDPAWQVVASALCGALWWHPLVWWLRHRLRAASEAAADEASLLVPDGPDVLAGCLVAMGRRLAPLPQFGWLSFWGPGFRSGLGRRVERLLNLRTRSWRAPGRGRLLLAKIAFPVALVITAVCCTAWARPQATLTEGGTTMQVLTTSWRHSLAAAVLALCSAGCSDAVADDPPIEKSLPATVAAGLADAQGQLALLAEGEQREDRDRGEGEARKREEREREEGEAREREDRQREEGEAREREEGERERGEAREREERERREVEAHRDRLAQELGRLEEKARDIRRKLGGPEPISDAKAEELQAALQEVEERMEAIRRELRSAEGVDEAFARADAERAAQVLRLLKERHKALGEQAAALQRELEGLLRDKQADQARRLRDKLADIRAAAERVGAEIRQRQQRLGRPGERPRPDQPRPDREQLKGRLAELRAKIDRLVQEGRHELAERLEGEAREIIELLEGRPEPPPPGPGEELQRRIGHLKVAIENLHAAGLHDQAEGLVREVDRLIEEHRGLIGRPPEPPRPPEPRERPVPPELAERLEQQGQAIRELHGAVNELREQISQLREMVQQLRRPERVEHR